MDKSVVLCFENQSYAILPDMRLICEIEDELGGIVSLVDRFTHQQWKVSELVALVHMMLAASGQTADYIALGNEMMKHGLESYLAAALRFLKQSLGFASA